MTEEEWLTCDDPARMLEFVTERLENRKMRLFACGLCATYRSYLTDERSWEAVETAYRVADGTADASEREQAFLAAHSVATWTYDSDAAAEVAAYTCGEHSQVREAIRRAFRAFAFDIYQNPRRTACHLLRDIFGNPFRPATVEPAWLTSTVVALAEGIYAEKAFDRMPILADALQDAGCDNDAILSHCRDTSLAHVRGCWVVDLLTGRE